MGVPAFYRWLTEKYPKVISEILEARRKHVGGIVTPVDLTQANPNEIEFDNLYVDMNGLIHPCSHPEDREAPKTEFEMYQNITQYVDRLFAAIRPRKLLFLAIDGVAPRAKMNQQRSRRFRAAQDAKEKHKVMESVMNELDALGLVAPPKSQEWDSNVITPGTEFMFNLSVFLRGYIVERMNSDPAWKKIQVILSDANEPGEGEHKIMNFVRCQRCQPGYDANIKHVIHGLDADLIMLALSTHEPNFYVLRELVTFGRPASQGQQLLDIQIESGDEAIAVKPADSWIYAKPLQILHVSILREYLAGEYSSLASALPFKFDFERVIDDFVFICFFVGNDFLPHLPSLDIRDGAIDFLIECYKELLPSIGSYLTLPGGNVNLSAVDILIGRVSEVEGAVFRRRKEADDEQIRRRTEDPRNLASRTARSESRQDVENNARSSSAVKGQDVDNKFAAQRLRESMLGKRTFSQTHVQDEIISVQLECVEGTDPAPNDLPISAPMIKPAEELKKRVKEMEQQKIEEYKASTVDKIRLHENGWKARYYEDPPKRDDLIMGGGKERMCETYVQGLCWVYKYYYEGCPSWNWFYPFHYAPFASDLINIDKVIINFEKSEPFSPMEQLLAVLPADSAHALPPCLQWLMTSVDSPIIDIYNSDAPLDPNGKHLPWLWVLLLPFIDEARIKAAFSSCKHLLNAKEVERNQLSGSLMFLHDSNKIVTVAVQNGFVYSSIEDSTLPSNSASFILRYANGSGIAAQLSLPSPSMYICLGGSLERSDQSTAIFGPISNRVLVLNITFPVSVAYASELLSGLAPSAPVLNAYDLVPRRPPRMNKGRFNLLELCSSTSMNRTNEIRSQTGAPPAQMKMMSSQFQLEQSHKAFNQTPIAINSHPSNYRSGHQGSEYARGLDRDRASMFAPSFHTAAPLQHAQPNTYATQPYSDFRYQSFRPGSAIVGSLTYQNNAAATAGRIPTIEMMRQQLAQTIRNQQQHHK